MFCRFITKSIVPPCAPQAKQRNVFLRVKNDRLA